jgi:hypothetical protein
MALSLEATLDIVASTSGFLEVAESRTSSENGFVERQLDLEAYLQISAAQ